MKAIDADAGAAVPHPDKKHVLFVVLRKLTVKIVSTILIQWILEVI